MEISDGDLFRFWFKVETGDDDKCWIWTAGFTSDGYGSFSYNGKKYRANIFSYLIHKGPTNGLMVCHTCDNRKCVNPAHLWLGTAKDNNDDKVDKDRQAKGENQGNSKLTEQEVLEIRAKYSTNNYTQEQLGKEYNVNQSTILDLIKRKTWKHI